MSFLISAIMPQIAFAQRIREFARAMACRVLPGVQLDELQLESNQIFESHLNRAIYSLPDGASDHDRRCAVVRVICKDATRLCVLLKNACRSVGLSEIADDYLNYATFFNFVLEQDNFKMDLLMSIAKNDDPDLGRVFFNIARVLKGQSVDYYRLGDDAKKKASDDIRNIAAVVRDQIARVGEKIDGIGTAVRVGFANADHKFLECRERLDAIDGNVSRLRRSGKSRGRYSEEAKTLCWACWTTASSHEEIWRGVNTRITYKAVFDYYKKRLERIGVTDEDAFRKIVHAESVRRNRSLHSARNLTSKT